MEKDKKLYIVTTDYTNENIGKFNCAGVFVRVFQTRDAAIAAIEREVDEDYAIYGDNRTLVPVTAEDISRNLSLESEVDYVSGVKSADCCGGFKAFHSVYFMYEAELDETEVE